MRIAKLKIVGTLLLLVLEMWHVKQTSMKVLAR